MTKKEQRHLEAMNKRLAFRTSKGCHNGSHKKRTGTMTKKDFRRWVREQKERIAEIRRSEKLTAEDLATTVNT